MSTVSAASIMLGIGACAMAAGCGGNYTESSCVPQRRGMSPPYVRRCDGVLASMPRGLTV